jgi:2-polyprenyl-3-methyl-5-hydroxy-6-metoxy-1,4-benzoquinol methylase
MTIEYCYDIYKRFLIDGSILELGPAEGLMTKYLVDVTRQLTLVDGSEKFCDELKLRFPGVEIINCLFEDFQPAGKYDNILLGHVLEHVEDPVAILKRVKSWLKDDGVILAAVPNSRSLHRQAAVIMGIQATEDSMSELDYHHGHRRIYSPETFRGDFAKADLKVVHFGGYWLKPIANSQIHATWTKEMLFAFMKLGERYPDIAGEIYVVASNK